MRRLLSLVAVVGAFLSIAIGAVIFNSSGSIDETLKHSHEIDAIFRDAARYVDEWRQTHGRLPASSEFEAWESAHSQTRYGGVQYTAASFPAEVVAEFGPPPHGEAYLFTLWRGKWNEYYASWANRSTLLFDRSKYFVFGSEWRDLVVFCILGMVLGWLGFAMWPPHQRRERPASARAPGPRRAERP